MRVSASVMCAEKQSVGCVMGLVMVDCVVGSLLCCVVWTRMSLHASAERVVFSSECVFGGEADCRCLCVLYMSMFAFIVCCKLWCHDFDCCCVVCVCRFCCLLFLCVG